MHTPEAIGTLGSSKMLGKSKINGMCLVEHHDEEGSESGGLDHLD